MLRIPKELQKGKPQNNFLLRYASQIANAPDTGVNRYLRSSAKRHLPDFCTRAADFGTAGISTRLVQVHQKWGGS